MPFQKLIFRPGVNRDTTNYANEGGWYECDKVRFFSGYPQKIGGWVRATSETVLGTCRQMWNWITSYEDNFLAVGTNKKVYIEVGGIFYDITPLRTTFTTSTVPSSDDCIDTTNGSNVVNVNIANHGCQNGDFVTISGSTDVGGIPLAEINAEHEITYVDANNFTFEVTSNATSTVSNGGGTAIIVECQISPGFPLATAGYGWGTSSFGGLATTGFSVTITNASPGVLTYTGYTPINGAVVVLTTTGTLPAGLSPGVPYYIVGASGSTSSLALTAGGTAINTTSTGSGSHTATLGEFGWGLASSTPTFLPQRDWWFDNFDNDLLMNVRVDTTASGASVGGPIYIWQRGGTVDPSNALGTNAVLLSSLGSAADVPANVGQLLISQNDKHLLAFGATAFAGSDYDPLLIRWASQDAPEYWTPGTQLAPNGLPSTAGFARVSRGSRIVRAIPTRQEIVVMTDTHLYSLQFTGTLDVFSLQELTDNISIISPRAVATANNVVFWMGADKFYRYDGRIQTLPCTLREYVFKDLNYSQADQIICGTNEGFNEIWWFYPSGASSWVDRYVVYNHLENIWYYGNLGRTAWLDTSPTPSAMFTPQDQLSGGVLYSHENGTNDDNLPMTSFISSSDFDIGDGEQFMLTRRVIPDINFNQSITNTPEINLTIKSKDWPGSGFNNDPFDTQRVSKTVVGTYTNQVFIRARGRQMALQISSDQLDVQWQLGAIRLDSRPDGKR
jgi:hypothetical protein